MAGWLRRLLGGGDNPPPTTDQTGRADEAGEQTVNAEHAVLVHVPLSDDEFGAEEECEALFELEDDLVEVVEGEPPLGEYDGNEVGGGEFVMYMYGPDADALFAAVEPMLRALDPPPGDFYAIKRYGPPEDTTREERIELR